MKMVTGLVTAAVAPVITTVIFGLVSFANLAQAREPGSWVGCVEFGPVAYRVRGHDVQVSTLQSTLQQFHEIRSARIINNPANGEERIELLSLAGQPVVAIAASRDFGMVSVVSSRSPLPSLELEPEFAPSGLVRKFYGHVSRDADQAAFILTFSDPTYDGTCRAN